MVGFLAFIAVVAYIFAALGFISALTGTDLQFILCGVFATCGTVALAGAGIVQRLEQLDLRSRVKNPDNAS